MAVQFFVLSFQLSEGDMPGDMTDKNFTAQKAAVNGEKITQIATCTERISPRQDSCWSWVVCFAGVVSNIVICGFTFSYGILFPALLDEFQQGKANTGKVFHREINNRTSGNE